MQRAKSQTQHEHSTNKAQTKNEHSATGSEQRQPNEQTRQGNPDTTQTRERAT